MYGAAITTIVSNNILGVNKLKVSYMLEPNVDDLELLQYLLVMLENIIENTDSSDVSSNHIVVIVQI